MRILVSNDDGIHAPGLAALAQAMEKFGEVFVVAPDRERSGAGHSLTLHRPLRIHARKDHWFAIDGTPTDCVSLGILEVMADELPQLVVSGINRGPNLGDDVTYSGTVAAALEGALLNVPSISFSLVAKDENASDFVPGAAFAQRVVQEVLQKGLPSDLILNVNIPDLEGKTVEEYEFTKLGKRRYAGAIAEKIDPRGRKYYWIGAEEIPFDDAPGTDCNAIRTGKASITPIRLNVTHEAFLSTIKEWKL